MKMVRVRVGYEDGQTWMHRVDTETPLCAANGVTDVAEVIMVEYEKHLNEGHAWQKWLRAVDDAVYAEYLSSVKDIAVGESE